MAESTGRKRTTSEPRLHGEMLSTSLLAFLKGCSAYGYQLSQQLSEAGLPLGIQLVSAPFAEEKLLTAAHWCEQVLGTGPPPPVGM